MTSIEDRGVIGFDLRMEPDSNLEKAAKEQRFSDDVPDIWISADPAVFLRHEDVDKIIQEYSSANVISLWNPLGLAHQLPALVDVMHPPIGGVEPAGLIRPRSLEGPIHCRRHASHILPRRYVLPRPGLDPSNVVTQGRPGE